MYKPKALIIMMDNRAAALMTTRLDLIFFTGIQVFPEICSPSLTAYIAHVSETLTAVQQLLICFPECPAPERRKIYCCFFEGKTTKDPRPKRRGIWRRGGERFSCDGERDVGLADASARHCKRRGPRPEGIHNRV